MVKETTYGADVDILIAPELAFALPCIVGNSGVSANEEGKKIIKAGTPLYGSANVYKERQTVLATSGTTPYGVARWDIDVTNGNTNASLLIAGYVDLKKLDASVVSAIATAESDLSRILFVNGREA